MIIPQILLLAPLIAMRVSDEVNWTASDFIIAGALLGVAGFGGALATQPAQRAVFRAFIGLAIIAAAALIWVQLAVGIFD